MIVPAGLPLWIARRCWPPAACALLCAALATTLVLPWTAELDSAAPALSSDVNAGLARQGTWALGGGLVLAWLAARSATSVRQWRRGEGDWLGTAMLSRGALAAAHSLGLGAALALGLIPVALAGELRAGGREPKLRWIGDTEVASVVLLEAGARAEFTIEAPRAAQRLEARFVVVSPGDGGPTALVRATLAPASGATIVQEIQVGTSTSLGVDVPADAGRSTLSFERIGPGAAILLAGRRVSWFSQHAAIAASAAALCLHAWIAGSVAAAMALAVAAWASPGTAFLAAFAALAGAWLATDAPSWIPGAGLRDALAWCGDGYAPGIPSLGAWMGWLAVQAAACAAVAVHRDLWRREA